jgi:hypothetical protein
VLVAKQATIMKTLSRQDLTLLLAAGLDAVDGGEVK